MNEFVLGLTVLSLTIWVGLLCFRGQFWQADQQLEEQATALETWPSVCAVIPARNEADLLPITLRSLLIQDYPGSFHIILVDDGSTDGTAKVARGVAQSLDKSQQLHILSAESLPPGWSGKLWAMEQGIRHAQNLTPPPNYLLFADADIEHDAENLSRLIAKAQQDDLDLVSLMVLLRCQSFWEQLLIPAFVFFFQKLYPFRWANNPSNSTAAAAGGCILIRREALNRIGGIQVIRQALIDDCALAQAVKSNKKGSEEVVSGEAANSHVSVAGSSPISSSVPHCSPTLPQSDSQSEQEARGRIWLGLTCSTRSLRPYPSLKSIWDMVARTAFTQLNYSPLLLLGTLLGMTLIYLVPPMGAIFGGLTGTWSIAIAGLSAWLLMAIAYLPTLRFYGRSPLLAVGLPTVALLYTFMTLDSALRHWQGRGGAWKGRVYSETI
jgi:cellulose synthase/poly-beta-1,6-N-acetylglucosamine synthase-like glycosyltransferase